MNTKSNRIFTILGILLVVLAIGYNVYTSAIFGQHGLDADSASEMVLANELNKEGKLLSENWYYSTEIRIVSPVPLYQLALKLFPESWHSARVFSNAILMIGAALSLIFAAKAAGIGAESLYAAAILVLPYSWYHRFDFTWFGFYTVYFMLACWIFLLVMHISKKKHGIIRLPILALLSLWGGLSGVRMLLIISVPLFLSALLLFFHRMIAEKETLKDCIREEEGLFLLVSLFSLLFMFIGYLINTNVLAEKYSFQQFGDSILKTFKLSSFLPWFDGFLTYMGYQEEKALVSIYGFIDIVIIAFVLFGLIAPFLLLKKNRKELPFSERMVPCFALVACVFVMILVMIIDDPYFSVGVDAISYFIAGAVFLTLAMFMLLRKWLKHTPILCTVLLTLLVAFFFVDSHYSIDTDVPDYDTSRERAAQWLYDHYYENGFATFWNGNLLTEFTNGELEITTFGAWNTPRPYDGLQVKRHLESFPEGEIFVVVDDAEMENYVPFAKEENLIYQDENIYVYAFDDASEVIDTLY